MRRRDRRIKYVVLGVFAAVVSLTFLLGRLRSNDADAASLASFDPGFIISDYTMSNYNSMTQAEIQSFLTRKNPCSNSDYDYYLSLTANNPGVYWHWKDGHFVCISEELFGEGTTIGEGKTAAQIIYETAQEYRINPQVLLVLIQKESSLITDPIPNNYDYRAMTGFGCPDTAPCDSKYYGFKNQIRKAAWLFREVLDGGWTNYPVGENYIQYNPNSGCGGSIVNVKNLATSALYRYTPYQPNAGAIAAGYGTAYCGAYGNRNFYLYFEDWFGGITDEKVILGKYKNMVVPRVLYVKNGSRYVDSGVKTIEKRKKTSFEYFTHLNYLDGNLCLSIGDGKNCYLYSDLEELEYSPVEEMTVSRMLIVKTGAKAIDLSSQTLSDVGSDKIIFSQKTKLNDQLCLISAELGNEKCVPYDQLSEIPEYKFSSMVIPRKLYIRDAKVINVKTGISREASLQEIEFFSSLTYWFGDLCLRPDSLKNQNECILYNSLEELKNVNFEPMVVPRFFRINEGTVLYDAEIEKNTNAQESGVLFFDQKVDTSDGLCLKANNMSKTSCILYRDLTEIENFTSMVVPRAIQILPNTHLFDIENSVYLPGNLEQKEGFFVDKIVLDDGTLCLRSQQERDEKQYRCIKYSNLKE